MTVTVTSKGQVTVPKQVRDRLGIKPGSKVDFEVADGPFCIGLVSALSNRAALSGCEARRPAG